MPLNIPNLDDRNYSDLVAEALAMLPRYAPEWTNHNPSDPGITLIELLAYFTEMLIYRLNKVSQENKIKFLQLLCPEGDHDKDVNNALRHAVLDLRRLERAVSADDYESLARTVAAEHPDQPQVKRACCFMRKNLEALDDQSRAGDCPGHVSLVLLSDREMPQSRLDDIKENLEKKRLLTTRLHVVAPRYLCLSLGAAIRTQPNVNFFQTQKEVLAKLETYFSPYAGGGPKGQGWPFGRAVYLSEIYELIDKLDCVDYVAEVRILRLSATSVALDDTASAVGIQVGFRSTVGVDTRFGGEVSASETRLVRDAAGRLTAIALRPYELVKIKLDAGDFVPPAV